MFVSVMLVGDLVGDMVFVDDEEVVVGVGY